MRESSALSRASPAMNIHEYQARELLQKFGVATTRGKVASTPEEAEVIAREIAEPSASGRVLQPSDAAPPTEVKKDAPTSVAWVVKAQVHAGGRGKGTFSTG